MIMMINRLMQGYALLRDETDGGDNGGGAPPAVTTGAPALSGALPPDAGMGDADEGVPPATGETAPAYMPYPDSPDGMEAYRQAMGIPATADDYPYVPDEGSEVSPEALGFIKAKGAEYGIPPQAMQGFIRDWLGLEAESAAKQQQAIDQGFKSLAKEWGGDYQARMDNAERAFGQLLGKAGLTPDDVPDSFKTSPAAFRLLATVSDLIGESPAKGVSDAQDYRSGSDEARRIESDASHPLHEAYMNHNHPNHKHANQVYDRLMGYSSNG